MTLAKNKCEVFYKSLNLYSYTRGIMKTRSKENSGGCFKLLKNFIVAILNSEIGGE